MKNCWLPYYHAEVDAGTGKIKPCCKYESPITWLDTLVDYNTVDRSEFEVPGLSTNCQGCNYKNSYRDIKIKHFKANGLTEPVEPKLTSLNVFLDNICSNSCLMCNPDHSSTVGYLLKKQVNRQFDINTLDGYIDSLRRVSILGGEPLQSPLFAPLCDKLKDSSVTHVNIITSLAKPLKGNIEALKNIKGHLNFRISIDGPHDLNEWIRGNKQAAWISTFEEIKNLGTINWQVTLGNYNVFALVECLDYLEALIPNRDFLPSIVTSPEPLRVAQLPQAIKDIAKEKLLGSKHINKYIVMTALELLDIPASLDWKQCKESIEHLPKLRKELLDFDYFVKKYTGLESGT